MQLIRVKEGGYWFISTIIWPPEEIGRQIASFSIQKGFGLWAGQLNSLEISIGGRSVSTESVAFTPSSGFSVTGTARITFPRYIVPLRNIVDWVKDNVISPKYVPFPPITLSSA